MCLINCSYFYSKQGALIAAHEKATYVPIQIINLSLALSRFKYAQERHRKTLAEISLEFVRSFALAKEIV